MTRTHSKHVRIYANGVDISGYSRNVGILSWEFAAQPDAAYTDECQNIIPGHANIQAGPINAFLDNDAAGLFNLMSAGGQAIDLMIALGVNAAPAVNDDIFAWRFGEAAYVAADGGGFVNANLGLTPAYCTAPNQYKNPWGRLLHVKGAETAVNSGNGVSTSGGTTNLGGVFFYHVFTSNGTVTVKLQHSTVVDGDGDPYADLTGATSGLLATAASVPKYGMVGLAATEEVERYLRWQVVFGTATTVTFVVGFNRRHS
jgi:hypothetical protein